jgi:pimeloyl-ACP methyl ester carboxylesterase
MMWARAMMRPVVTLLLACIASLALPAQAPQQTKAVDCASSGIGTRSIREHTYVSIGGIDQWLTIDSTDCGLPVLLLVHGGPGNPISPFVEELYGSWKSSFTIATWDQRLSGKTYGRNEPLTELTEARLGATQLSLQQLVGDGIEVAEYLRKRLGKDKIILTGTSWGSVLGVHMVHRRPDLFVAYIGVSQLVNARENSATSYAATLAMARRKQDAAAVSTLEEVGPPPWTNPRSFGRLRRIIRAYEAELSTPGPTLKIPPEYASDSDRAAYEAGEEISFVKYVGLKGDGMDRDVDLAALGIAYEVPMLFVQGESDLLTRPEVTRAFFETLRAPRKKFFSVPSAGHDPNFAMIEAQFRVLRDEVLPLVR